MIHSLNVWKTARDRAKNDKYAQIVKAEEGFLHSNVSVGQSNLSLGTPILGSKNKVPVFI